MRRSGRRSAWVGALLGFASLALAQKVPATATAPAAPGPLVEVQVGEPRLGRGWRVVTLPSQKPPVTRYSAVVAEGRPAVRVEAQASYGNLVHHLAGAAPRELGWTWRVEQANPGTVLHERSGDDTPAKVCLSFELPLSRVPFFERELLRLARSRTGEPLPAATLCWVWGGPEARGSLLANPYSKRVRYIVLRNAADASGTWFEETRDVAADWQRAFGDESAEMPPISAVIVSGDADNTVGSSLALVGGLRWGP